MGTVVMLRAFRRWASVDLAASGRMVPPIDRVFPLEQIRDAHAYVDTGRKRGSVVVTMV